MKVLIVVALAALAHAKSIQEAPELLGAYGYNRLYSIPLGEKIKAIEEANLGSRIVGGSVSNPGQFPYQVGVLTSYVGFIGSGVCGGSLVTPNRVLHAAHCWYDGETQGFESIVVLGTNTLFFGGTRIATRDIVMHPQWIPSLIRNDVAVIRLPSSVSYSSTISPIALPTGSQLNENFAGETAVASGFGLTSDNGVISNVQVLSHVQLNIITNNVCRWSFPFILTDNNICTSGAGGTSTCRGDSGGPLAVTRNGQPLLVGLTSFGSGYGCQQGYPAVFARITSFMSFFNEHL